MRIILLWGGCLIKEYCMVFLVQPPISPGSVSTTKGNVLVWHDGGLVLACDRISSLVTYMKVKREGVFGRDLFVDYVVAFCFTVVFYVPLRKFIPMAWCIPLFIFILKYSRSQGTIEGITIGVSNMSVLETFLVAGDLGVQVKRRFKSGRETATFVPIDEVKDVKMLEGFHRWSIVNVMAVIRMTANHLLVFQSMKPTLKILNVACEEAKAVLSKVKEHQE